MEYTVIDCYLICGRERFCFTASFMEICLSSVGEKPVCADLGLLFSFGVIHKENSWQLHSGYRRSWQWTACWCCQKGFGSLVKHGACYINSSNPAFFTKIYFITWWWSLAENMTCRVWLKCRKVPLQTENVFDEELFYIKTAKREYKQKDQIMLLGC